MKHAILVVLLLLCCVTAFAGEREEVTRLAPNYKAEEEVQLWDKTRVDLLNKEYAIEVDWAPKWAEAIGQSLYYSTVTELEPGIILLVKDISKEARYVYRCQTVAAKYGIKVWIEQVKQE